MTALPGARVVGEHLHPRLQESFTVREDNGEILTASWKRLDSFNDYHRLVPVALTSLLKSHS
jgi:hypothetical protein